MAIFRVTITAAFRGQLMQNVLHFDNLDGGITATTICNTIAAQWLDQQKGFSVNQVFYINVACAQIFPVLGLTANLAINIQGDSNATTPQTQPCVSEVVRVQTATPGRHGRGRFFPPVADLQGGDVGVVTAATIAARNAKLNTLMGRFAGATPSTGIRFGIVPRDSPGDFKPAISMTLGSKYAYLRSREIGIGI